MERHPIARVPHQPTAISLMVEQLPDGRMRLSSPQARGWAWAASTPRQLAEGLHHAFREVQVASYAHGKGEAYDLDALTEHRPGDALAGAPQRRPRRLGGNASYNPADWQKTATASGEVRWRSPSGRLYRSDSQHAERLVAKRVELNLPV